MRRALYQAAPLRRLILLVSILLLNGADSVPAGDDAVLSGLTANPNLPDPLMLRNGERVTTAEKWFHERRVELKGLFQKYMYGQLPRPPEAIKAVVDREDSHYFGGKATKREVTLRYGTAETPPIHLLLVTPNNAKKPVPTFLGLNFYGNHTALNDPTIALPDVWVPSSAPGANDNRATDAGRGKQADVWSVEKVIDHGYALATFYCGDVAPDHPGFKDGLFPTFAPAAEPRANDALGAVGAWAWGLSRAYDYLITLPEINGQQVALVGHSRLGKAALVAGAFDERFALVIGHQAGCGGSAPSRGKVGEQVKQINDRFPHWFAGAFKHFNDHVDLLPFDQNGLFAMVAPRPLLLTNGEEDTWANPVGQFEALKGASGVYELLGQKGLDGAMPPVGKRVGDRLAYHIRAGKHAMLPEDWDVFLAFADQHFKK